MVCAFLFLNHGTSVTTIDEGFKAARSGETDILRARFTNIDVEFREPPGQERQSVAVKVASAMEVFGEPGHFVDQMAFDQAGEPGRWFLTEVGLEFGFQDRIRETEHFGFGQVTERIVDLDVWTAPSTIVSSYLAVQAVFADKRQVRVEGDAQPLVVRQLKRGPVVVHAQHGLQLLLLDRCLYAACNEMHVLHSGFVGIGASQLVCNLVSSVSALEKRAQSGFLDAEPVLDGCPLQPWCMVRLALHKDIFGIIGTVPIYNG